MLSLKTINGESFDLADNFSVQFKFASPFLSEEGSYSLPCSIPATQRNLRLLDYPNIIDRREKYTYNSNVVLENGVRKIVGKIEITAITDFIEFNIFMEEGEFYDRQQDVKLNELDWGPDRFPQNAQVDFDEEWRTAYLLDKIYPVADYAIFPVIFKNDDKEIHVLNRMYFRDNFCNQNSLSFFYDVMQNNLPYCAPFLFLQYVINTIFRSIGLEIKRNDLSSIPEMNRIVVLHNTMNALNTVFSGDSYKYYFNYKDLLPTCSISEFINAVENTFACNFYYNFNSNEVNIISNNPLLIDPASIDLTKYLTSKPKPKIKKHAGITFSPETLQNAKDFEYNKSLQVGDKEDAITINSVANFLGNRDYIDSIINEWVDELEVANISINGTEYLVTRFITHTYLIRIDYHSAPIFTENFRIIENLPSTQELVDYAEFSNITLAEECPIAFSVFRGTKQVHVSDFTYTEKTVYENVAPGFENDYQNSSSYRLIAHATDLFVPYGTTFSEEDNHINISYQESLRPGQLTLHDLWSATIDFAVNSNREFVVNFKLPPIVLQKLEKWEKIRLFNRDYIIKSWSESHRIDSCQLEDFIINSITSYEDP